MRISLSIFLLSLVAITASAQVRISQFPPAVPPILGGEIFWIDRDPFSAGSTRKATVTQVFGIPLNTARLLTDPGADRIGFWDDSAGAFTWLSLDAATLNITGTVLSSTSLGVTDGDKGSVTVSGIGTVWTIDPLAVALGMMAVDSVNSSKIVDRGVVDVDIEYAVTGKTSAGGTLTFDFAGSRRQTNAEAGALTIAFSNKPTTAVDRWQIMQFSPTGTMTPTWPTTVSGSPVRQLTAMPTTIGAGVFTEIYFGWNGFEVLLDKRANLTTGVGITNVLDVLSVNLAAGANTTFTTNASGQLEIASTGGGSGGGNMFNTGANAIGTVPRASDTSSTNYVPSLLLVAPTTGNMTLGDDTQATITRVTRVTGTDVTETITAAGVNLGASAVTAGVLTSTAQVIAGANSFLGLSGLSRFQSITNGYWNMTDNANTDFIGLRWGLPASGVMLLKTNVSGSNGFEVMLANQTAQTFLRATTLDTGQGANELYDMDQNVQTTSDVVFNSLTTPLLNVGTLNLTNKLARSLITNGVPNQIVSNDGTGLLTSLGVGTGLAIVGTNLTSTGGGVGSGEIFVSTLGLVLDGQGSVITTGLKSYFSVPYNCTIQSVTMLADQTGSVVVDVWKDTYANYPPTVADTITGSAKPTITAAIKSQNTVLTGWTNTITAGDVLAFNVDSASSITKLTLAIKVIRTADTVIGITIDGGGAAIAAGVKGYLEIPYACTISSVTMLADQSGSAVVDIWKDTYANYPPTVADTITASAKPTITTAIKSQDSTLTGWTKTVAAGDIIAFNVDSATTIQRLTMSLKITR